MRKSVNLLVILANILCIPMAAFAQLGTGGGAGALGSFLPLILIFVFFYLFLIRPQQRKAKEHQKSLNALKKGDKVITSGGIYGTISAVRDNNILEVKIADGVTVQVAKQSIATIITKETDDQAKVPEVVKK
ncbi:MAG: preprotein translocase subunit YajC [Endomicrobium sp.]|jgi:preprotein translocase subunit YajC|uniref:preprotein translocase subunit YajC n=1 Tax=Candidatus Endomicrobiellum cubanum TaxID=3242325 RepID=UPI002829CDC9|nr:preprotein translocase subunit YajC [Endomicrobium sp.]